MSVVRLVRERVGIAEAVQAFVEVKDAVRGVMPGGATVDVCLDGQDGVKVTVLVSSFQEREVAAFNLESGLVPDLRFRSVTQGMEHVTRGRHRVCAVLDI